MTKNFYALVLIILSIGLYFTITKDIIAEAQLVLASNKEYTTAIENAAKLVQVREKVLADYNKLSVEDRAKLDKFVPKNVDNIRLVIDLNSIAARNNLAISGITISASDSKNNGGGNPQGQSTPSAEGQGASSIASPVLEKVSVSFAVNASYQQFIIFIQDLEASLRIFDIKSISLTSSDDGMYKWSVQMDTYWLKN